MAKQLQKTYSRTNPYVVQRYDLENGLISYEIWDERPESYRRLCTLTEGLDSLDYVTEEGKPNHTAKSDAELIVQALNCMGPGVLSC